MGQQEVLLGWLLPCAQKAGCTPMTIDLAYYRSKISGQEHYGSPHVGLTTAQFAAILDELDVAVAERDELLRWKQQREMDDYEELVASAKQRRARR